jgi:hypothetical protein
MATRRKKSKGSKAKPSKRKAKKAKPSKSKAKKATPRESKRKRTKAQSVSANRKPTRKSKAVRDKEKSRAKPSPTKTRKPKRKHATSAGIDRRKRKRRGVGKRISPPLRDEYDSKVKSAVQTGDTASARADEAFATITARLSQIQDARVRVWPYSDGSIDGEALVKVPRGVSTNDLLLDLEETFGREGIKGGFWMSVGVRFTIKEDEEIYRRYKGYNDVNTHFQPFKQSSVVDVFNIARHEIATGMEGKYGRKPDSVYVRIHWNPEGSQPKGREPH